MWIELYDGNVIPCRHIEFGDNSVYVDGCIELMLFEILRIRSE